MAGVYICHNVDNDFPIVADRNDPILEGPFGDDPNIDWELQMVGRILSSEGDKVHKIVYAPCENDQGNCVSQWTQPLPERAWGAGEVFLTTILWETLSFVGTAFEHRCNHVASFDCEEYLYKLADDEAQRWGVHHKGFVPFKNPQPNGYKGIYGSFGRELEVDLQYDTLASLPECICVRATYEGGCILELL